MSQYKTLNLITLSMLIEEISFYLISLLSKEKSAITKLADINLGAGIITYSDMLDK
jgi:hypothetical protein